jgi:hypothetical protein
MSRKCVENMNGLVVAIEVIELKTLFESSQDPPIKSEI